MASSKHKHRILGQLASLAGFDGAQFDFDQYLLWYNKQYSGKDDGEALQPQPLGHTVVESQGKYADIDDDKSLQLDDMDYYFKGKCLHSIRREIMTALRRYQEDKEDEGEISGEAGKLTEKAGNLEDEIRFCIRKMYPDLCKDEQANNEFAIQQIKELESLVYKMVQSQMHEADSGKPDESVKVILGCLQRVFPNRTYYHLLIHWARRAKVDFVKEVMTVLITLNSNFEGQKLTEFLDNCRDWKMIIPTAHRKYLKMGFYRLEDVPQYENIVTMVSASLQICGLHLAKTHEIMMATPRMSSTKTKKIYGTSNTPSADGHFSVHGEGTHPSYELEVEASLGTHVPKTVNCRIWLTIEHVKLGYELHGFLFKDLIQECNLFSNTGLDPNERVLQYLFHYMSCMGDRAMWVNALVDLCCTVKRLDSYRAKEYDECVVKPFKTSKPHELPMVFNNRGLRGQPGTLLREIVETYKFFTENSDGFYEEESSEGKEPASNNNKKKPASKKPEEASHGKEPAGKKTNKRPAGKKKKKRLMRTSNYRTWKRKGRWGDAICAERAYQTLRVNIFRHYLSFSRNAMMRETVHAEVYGTEISEPQSKKRKTNKSSSKAHEHPFAQCGPALSASRQECPYEMPTLGEEAAAPVGGQPSHNEGVGGGSSKDGDTNQYPKVADLPDGTETQEHGDENQLGGSTGCTDRVTYDDLRNDPSRFRGDEFKLISTKELEERIDSRLWINCKDHKVVQRLAPLEVYTATKLAERLHGRATRDLMSGKKPPYDPGDQPCFFIPMKTQHCIDPNDDLHVIRPGSSVWRQCAPKVDLKVLLQYLIFHGDPDSSDRRVGESSKVFEFGVKPELESKKDGKPVAFGDKVFSPREGETESDKKFRETAQWSLGRSVQFIWDAMQVLQALASKPAQGGIPFRDEHFASILRKILGPGVFTAEFESCTAVHTILTLEAIVMEHMDTLNDIIYMYCKTGCLNAVFVDAKKTIHLLQILCNFRRGARDRITPGAASRIDSIVKHFREYEKLLRERYINMLAPTKKDIDILRFITQPHDMSDFSLHPDLPYQSLNLFPADKANFNGKTYDLIEEKFLLLPIGTSRWISMSGTIEPIFNLREHLCLDQLVEIAFLASFLSTHVQFNNSMRHLKSTLIQEDTVHPFFDILRDLDDRFPSWQGGIEPRYSSCNDTLMQIIGCGREEDEDKKGPEKLKAVVESLLRWIKFINSLQGKSKASEIPYDLLRNKMKQTVEDIQKACPPLEPGGEGNPTKLDFGLFRLSVLTTILTGSGLVEPGPHLYQLNILAVTAASLHLQQPNTELTQEVIDRAEQELAAEWAVEDGVTPGVTPALVELEQACVANSSKYKGVENHPDFLMAYISSEMRWPVYRRVLVENYLCESKANRQLYKNDLFREGQMLFDVRGDSGVPMYKKYNTTVWSPVMSPVKKGFRFASPPPVTPELL